MSERVEIEVDAATARWLRTCAHLRGTSTGAAAAAQLRALALAEAGDLIDAWRRAATSSRRAPRRRYA